MKIRLQFIICMVLLSISACKQSVDKSEQNGIETTKNSDTILPDKNIQFPTINIKQNQKLASPQMIIVNSEGVWFANEGELGSVKLVDNLGNKMSLGILTTEEEWMTDKPVIFSTQLTFDPKNKTKGKLIVMSNAGEGEGEEAKENERFEIEITF